MPAERDVDILNQIVKRFKPRTGLIGRRAAGKTDQPIERIEPSRINHRHRNAIVGVDEM